MSDSANPAKEINLMQLVSDVSRTLNGFRNLLIPAPGAAGTGAAAAAAQNDAPSLAGGANSIFSGDVCFKACGMEDIQLAAQRAGDLFVTLRYCVVIVTAFVILCMILLSVALGWYLLRGTLVSDGRSATPIGSTLSGTSLFTHQQHQKTRSPTPTRENLKK